MVDILRRRLRAMTDDSRKRQQTVQRLRAERKEQEEAETAKAGGLEAAAERDQSSDGDAQGHGFVGDINPPPRRWRQA